MTSNFEELMFQRNGFENLNNESEENGRRSTYQHILVKMRSASDLSVKLLQKCSLRIK